VQIFEIPVKYRKIIPNLQNIGLLISIRDKKMVSKSRFYYEKPVFRSILALNLPEKLTQTPRNVGVLGPKSGLKKSILL